jgi:hypothetical protein
VDAGILSNNSILVEVPKENEGIAWLRDLLTISSCMSVACRSIHVHGQQVEAADTIEVDFEQKNRCRDFDPIGIVHDLSKADASTLRITVCKNIEVNTLAVTFVSKRRVFCIDITNLIDSAILIRWPFLLSNSPKPGGR